MLKHDPNIDYERFVEVYNKQGKAEASRLTKTRYNLSFQQMKRRLERQTDYRFDATTGEYRHREVPTTPEKFLSLEELERSRKPVQIPDPVPSDLDFDKLVMELVYDRGLELSRYILDSRKL